MRARLAWAALAASAMACEDLDQLAARACERSASCADAGHAGGGAGTGGGVGSTGGGSGGAPGGGTAGGGTGTGGGSASGGGTGGSGGGMGGGTGGGTPMMDGGTDAGVDGGTDGGPGAGPLPFSVCINHSPTANNAPTTVDLAGAHAAAAWFEPNTQSRYFAGGQRSGDPTSPWVILSNAPGVNTLAVPTDSYLAGAVPLPTGGSSALYVQVKAPPERNGYPAGGATVILYVDGVASYNMNNPGLSVFPDLAFASSSLWADQQGSLDVAAWSGWQKRRFQLSNEVDLPSTVGFLWPMTHGSGGFSLGAPRWFACEALAPVYVRAAVLSNDEYFVLLSTACPTLTVVTVPSSGEFLNDAGGYDGPTVNLADAGVQSYLVHGALGTPAVPPTVKPLGPADPFAGAIAVDRARDAVWVALSGATGEQAIHQLRASTSSISASLTWLGGPGDRLESLAVDSRGNAFAVGSAQHAFSINDAGYTPKGNGDALAVRLSADGGLHSVGLYGGGGADRFQSIRSFVQTVPRLMLAGTTDGGLSAGGITVAAPPAESMVVLECLP